MKMDRIFANVDAEFSSELVKHLQTDYVFHARIKKLSEEAGVDFFMNGNKISVKVIWSAIEHVHALLLTALEMYESYSNNKTNERKIDFSNETSGFIEVKKEPLTEETFEKIHPSDRNLLLQDYLSEGINRGYPEDDQAILESDYDYDPEECLSDEAFSVEFSTAASEQASGSCFPSNSPLKVRFIKNENYKIDKSTGLFVVKERTWSNGTILETSNGEYKCCDCEYTAKAKCTVSDHRKRVHLSTPTACDICDKVFSNKRYMVKHKEWKHQDVSRLCCDICGKTYKNKHLLLRHRKIHAEGYIKPSFQCDMCHKTFRTTHSLKVHVKSEHLGEKRPVFLCPICGKCFNQQFSLKEHLNTHTGETPYSCDICGRSYSYQKSLRIHKMTHGGEKKFQCTNCSKCFYTSGELKKHGRAHDPNAERPFTCKHCGKSFYDSGKMRRHLKMVHKIERTGNTRNWREDVIHSKPSTTDEAHMLPTFN